MRSNRSSWKSLVTIAPGAMTRCLSGNLDLGNCWSLAYTEEAANLRGFVRPIQGDSLADQLWLKLIDEITGSRHVDEWAGGWRGTVDDVRLARRCPLFSNVIPASHAGVGGPLSGLWLAPHSHGQTSKSSARCCMNSNPTANLSMQAEAQIMIKKNCNWERGSDLTLRTNYVHGWQRISKQQDYIWYKSEAQILLKIWTFSTCSGTCKAGAKHCTFKTLIYLASDSQKIFIQLVHLLNETKLSCALV